MRATLQKIDNGICTVCGWTVGALIGALIVLNFTQLVTRYFIDVTFTWAEEVSTLMLIFSAAIGAPWVTLRRGHLKMDAAAKLLSPQVKRVAHWVAHLLIFTMAVLYVIIGVKTTQANTGFSISILGYDESLLYMPLIFEGIFLGIAELIAFAEDVLDAKSGKLVIK